VVGGDALTAERLGPILAPFADPDAGLSIVVEDVEGGVLASAGPARDGATVESVHEIRCGPGKAMVGRVVGRGDGPAVEAVVASLANALAALAGTTHEHAPGGAAAHRLEAELALSRRIQRSLIPLTPPVLRGFEVATHYEAAREVGGDFFDVFPLRDRAGRAGIVIADVTGKGIAAALLMANLQANLRSQCATAVEQPEQMLQSVNRLFYENTAENAYATLFYSEYDDRTCRLRYANCGHPPGLVVQSDGTVRHLSSTAPVLGLFAEWPCSTADIQLCAGDLFAIYTDGVTEALNQRGEEFGEERLLDVMKRAREQSPSDIVTTVFEEVRRFSGDRQRDDITLIVARCRSQANRSDGC